jgi:alcohol dehydrogenase
MPESASARALVLERPRRLVLREIPLPAVGDDDALVRVQACGLCGTDHEQYTGELAGERADAPPVHGVVTP